MADGFTWSEIRPLNGSQNDGFEELCCQLANQERPEDSSFRRKGIPDAGVECFAAFSDESEWGWQAKYFDELGESQLRQLDKSVRTAIAKHPKLTRYYVCIPLDLADPRLKKRKSAQDRWNTRLAKWKKWAAKKEMSVEFVYWGSHELIDRLSRPENRGRALFWFDHTLLDESWFTNRLEAAVKSASARYTPEIHVDLPIAQEFEAMARSQRFIDTMKAHAPKVRKELRQVAGKTLQETTKTGPKIEQLLELTGQVSKATTAILDSLGGLAAEPVRPLPLRALADEIPPILETASQLTEALHEKERCRRKESELDDKQKLPSYRTSEFEDQASRVYVLERRLRELRHALTKADELASAGTVLLSGRAGAGKTHLLCDIAKARALNGQLTVLLLGQWFTSTKSPWIQALQLLDLDRLSAEEFVAALEVAAETSGQRVLFLIDAMNEGEGRKLWSPHLEAFLCQLERSEWVLPVLAARTSYEELVFPESVREASHSLVHDGFQGHEYDAVKTFFEHYKIEMPSAPLLVPEFSNPLFLKVLCKGLRDSHERRLPRGFHGITRVFELLFDTVNKRLARELDYHEKSKLVHRAIDRFAESFVGSTDRWLPLEQAQTLVDALLPGRDFERSLYRALVSEGILTEDYTTTTEGTGQEVVYLAYERLSDHILVKRLLSRHHPVTAADELFAENGPLAYLADPEHYTPPGVLEALCVQVPEVTGKELLEIAPEFLDQRAFSDAFFESLVWRGPDAIGPATRETVGQLVRRQGGQESWIEVLLTLSTLEGHAYNAHFLHGVLSRNPMADRDAWWSTHLSDAWGERGALDRLVDWAMQVTPDQEVGQETARLAATVLGWTLTTSNRFLRDSSTKALVCLLSGRLPVVRWLLSTFATVDDLYVTERLHAVAYGCAMRSTDTDEVGSLAQSVYDEVFRAGFPPAHILLRDYARGTIERALYLRAELDIAEDLIRPPYGTPWPPIPSEEQVKAIEGHGAGKTDLTDEDRARNTISSSVLHDDFARYVIGTNSGANDWLSLRIDEPQWQSREERLSAWTEELSAEERSLWGDFVAAHDAYERQYWRETPRFAFVGASGEDPDAPTNQETSDELKELGRLRDAAASQLETTLSPELAAELEEILNTNQQDRPRFDLRLIQRYVLARVFELGWTKERFGAFDSRVNRSNFREAAKRERIGKKYQWISYHEVMAMVADNFQYREGYNDEDCIRAYQGTWLGFQRNIDPSCVLRNTHGGTSQGEHTPSWWCPISYSGWSPPGEHEAWLRADDIPPLESLLVARHPSKSAEWLSMNSYYSWKQETPPEIEPNEIDRQRMCVLSYAYLIKGADASAFMRWAETVDFYGRWMPGPQEIHEMFLGEYIWSPAGRFFASPRGGDPGWLTPGNDCPVVIRPATAVYSASNGGFDCSLDDNFTLRLPNSELVQAMKLSWGGRAGDFLGPDGELASFDPTAYEDGPSAVLLRKGAVEQALRSEGWALAWTVIGEKLCLPAGSGMQHRPRLRMSGSYCITTDGPSGFLRRFIEGSEGPSSKNEELAIIRC